LSKINGFDQLRDSFLGNADFNTVVHHLMYYCPDNNLLFATLYTASKSIDQMLVEQIDMKLNDNQKQLMKWLDGSKKGSPIVGFFFEKFVHKHLLVGGHFEMQSLANLTQSMIDTNQTN
jgi:hypothetical protein